VRPRIGFAVTPSAILYLTGGLDYGHVSANVITPAGTVSSGNDKIGWTGGFGLEYALVDWMSFKTEFLYLDLGSNSIAGAPGLNSVMRAYTLKAGLNFKLAPWVLQ
jgi:outer membrane immunogenic protein